MKEKVKIIVATHKKYEMPKDSIYLPLQVGAEGKESLGYKGDNTGDNISKKNSSFCELTGLYWAWKNINAEYIGLVHYRRYFTLENGVTQKLHPGIETVLSGPQVARLVMHYDVIVPKKQHYVVETLYSHYAHTHYKEHLDKTRKIICQKYPEYVADYDWAVSRRSGYMFNMFIMKKELLNDYCSWLFDILFELENQIKDEKLSPFQSRLYGRVSEIIFNCWLNHNCKERNLKVKAVPYIYLGKVQWGKKIVAFLNAKVAHKKYEGSF